MLRPFPIFLGIIGSLLWSCGSNEVNIQHNPGDGTLRSVFHQGSYSTRAGAPGQDSGTYEEAGTVTGTYVDLRYGQEGERLTLERKLAMDMSKGYHKHSLPLELSYRVPYVLLSAKGMQVEAVRGNEHFVAKVVESLPIKEKFKRQLRDARFQMEFDRYDKKRWELTHMVNGSVPLLGDITEHLTERQRIPLYLQVDSVIAHGFQKVGRESCYEYTVYYREREAFPYFLWEQFAYGTTAGKPYQSFKADSAYYQVAYAVALEEDTGIPCREREVKQGVHYISHPESREQAVFRSYISIENLYSKPESDS